MSLKVIVQTVATGLMVTSLFGLVATSASASHLNREEENTCTCRASVRLSRPDLHFANGVLQLIPRVDVTIRTRGEGTNPPNWAARLAYEGGTSYESEDVTVPDGVSFSGSQDIQSGQCARSNYRFRGIALPAVTLSGLMRTLVGEDQEVDGAARLKVRVEGCGEADEEQRQFGFRLGELGNLRVGSWRSVR